MNRIGFALLGAFALSLVACSGDENQNNNNNPPPPKPALKTTQIDRMGRAGVNTALTDPFDVPSTVGGMTEDQAKDAYNALADSSTWAGQFKSQIAFNLAILDSLDQNCGNQLLAGASATAGRYDTLAGALADDRLYVRTDKTSCTVYLAAEANATGVIPNDDCGGRTPLYNTIDVTYSLLAIGAPSGVTNGFTQDAEQKANATTFPFLGSPN